MRVPAWLSWWEPTPGLQTNILYLLHGGKRAREFSGVSFIRALILFMRAPLSWPNYFPRAHFLNYHTGRLGCQHMNSEGTHSVQMSTIPQSFLMPFFHPQLLPLSVDSSCCQQFMYFLSLQTSLNFHESYIYIYI